MTSLQDSNITSFRFVADAMKVDVSLVREILLNDRSALMRAIEIYPAILLDLPQVLLANKDIVTHTFSSKKNKYSTSSTDLHLYQVPEFLRDDKEFVINIFNYCALESLSSVSSRLRNDRDVVLLGVTNWGMNFKYASEELKNDKTIAMAAVKSYPYALEDVPKKYLDDYDVALAANTNKIGGAYKFLSERIRGDRNFLVDVLKKEVDSLVRCDLEEGWGMCSMPPILPNAAAKLQQDHQLNALSASNFELERVVQYFDSLSITDSFFTKLNGAPEWCSNHDIGCVRTEISRRNNVKNSILQSLKREEDIHAYQLKQREYINQYKGIRKVIESMPRYKTWRNEVLQKHNVICAKCGSAVDIEVDHYPKSMFQLVKEAGLFLAVNEQEIIDRAYEYSGLWDVNNGAPLCKQCHDRTTSSQAYRKLNS